MDRKKFVLELKKQTENSEKIVMKYLPDPEDKFQHSVMEAINYSVTVGGKRLRPLLIQETYRMFRGQDDYVEPFMAAIEMIHTCMTIFPVWITILSEGDAIPPGKSTVTQWPFLRETVCSTMHMKPHSRVLTSSKKKEVHLR